MMTDQEVNPYKNPIAIRYLTKDNRIVIAVAFGKLIKPISDSDKHQVFYLVDDVMNEPHLINARDVIAE